MMGAVRILSRVFRRSRWREYRRILEAALDQGYRLMTVHQWHQAGPERSGLKAMVLRHDIDGLPFSSLKLLEAEQSLGIGATYYFRWETADPEVIARVRRGGGEVGLHHEAIRFAAIRRHITLADELTDQVLDEAAQSLGRQIDAFEGLFGPIFSIAAHGSAEHRALGVRDVVLVERLPERFRRRICSAYASELLDAFDEYISDSGPPKVWRYGPSPREAMQMGRQRICFLSHPSHWDFSLSANLMRIHHRLR